MKFEKTQRGNPHRLTIHQHVFPKRSIDRYVGDDERVAVRRSASEKEVRLRSNDRIFCARRAWDHKSEVAFMKTCEDKFQAVAVRVAAGGNDLTLEETYAVSVFSALWRARFARRRGDQVDLQLKGLLPGREWTVDEQEQLERTGVTFLRGTAMPGRFHTGMAISYETSKMAFRMRGIRWGVQRAVTGEMILPDTFGDRAVVPVSPSICLFAGMDDGALSAEEVRALNRIAIDASVDYVAARDFAACPL